MLQTFTDADVATGESGAISDALEQGHVVQFPKCPFALPSEADLHFLREVTPKHLKRKNVSYHPEVDRVVGLQGDPEVLERAKRILTDHSARLQEFLMKAIPRLAAGWKVGTSSFRPLQEKGREISAHKSSELVHIDAGAYGATHGDRILRFFVNANPTEHRVWVSKGAFPELYRDHAERAGLLPATGNGHDLRPGLADRLRTGALRTIARAGFPPALLVDSSPYDRLMRRFHNYMKDTPEFQSMREGHVELSFPPGTAWMVFPDGVSHACLSGRHAFIDTFIIPLENCRFQDLAPFNILAGGAPPRVALS